jgi:hypothetical protein
MPDSSPAHTIEATNFGFGTANGHIKSKTRAGALQRSMSEMARSGRRADVALSPAIMSACIPNKQNRAKPMTDLRRSGLTQGQYHL